MSFHQPLEVIKSAKVQKIARQSLESVQRVRRRLVSFQRFARIDHVEQKIGNHNTYYAPSSISGAGIDVVGTGTSTLITLHNTILAGNVVVPAGGTPILKDLNTSTQDTILVKPPTYESLGWNLIQAPGSATITGTTTGNLLGIDPLLGPLADNGGPTRTMALLPGSPAIDAGDGTGAPANDQRGFARVVGAASDVGAFEVQPGRIGALME
jgi:hypothetical protein